MKAINLKNIKYPKRVINRLGIQVNLNPRSLISHRYRNKIFLKVRSDVMFI